MDAFMEEFQHLKIQQEEIKSATSNFDDKNIIGKGGFGKVYQGVLQGHNIVAFKRLDRYYGQGDPEFLKEIFMLSRYTHENLISLLGYCDEDGEKIIVYEHAFHGSLDRHLSSSTLTWRQRLKICLGAAKGLCYLHDPKETKQRVIHRDIKSSNILLDENWNAKVSDMGLSKTGSVDQQHSFLVSQVVGTIWYVDPMYMETSILTKESDVYSFGLVLLEVLCGRLCYENDNGHFKSLVRMWKQSYEEKKLDEIIFRDLKQEMDPSSLETFSSIAYRCLHKSREERPKMSHVVENLEIALGFQERSEEVEQPMDYEEMIKSALPPLSHGSEEELKMLLSKGILVNDAKTWFWLNKNGEHCEIISTTECLIPIHTTSLVVASYGRKSRFPLEYYRSSCLEFRINVRAQFLSPHIAYTVNLVFSFGDKSTSNDYLGFTYMLAGETKSSTSYFADTREDGWLMAELYQFTSKSRNLDLEITFKCTNAIAVEGIEFQPMERVEEHQVLEDEEVDMQTLSDSDTYWEHKLPSDYEDIIKRSKDSLQWTTKKKLYSIFCKGFPIKMVIPVPKDIDTSKKSTYTFIESEWFSVAKNGKKCHMVPARMALQEQEWRWKTLRESRFEEVAFGHRYGFRIFCISNMLSIQTAYACYLVYKLQENHAAPWPPVKVHISLLYGYPNHVRNAYLVGPQTPILRPKEYQSTHNTSDRPKMKGLPRLRNDGWMEVQVWEFQTGITGLFAKDLQFTFFDKNSPKGLIVEGIEFRPI